MDREPEQCTVAQLVTATVRAFGAQHPRVHGYLDGGIADAAYVLVQVGSTLVYAYDLPAVRSFTGAWREAASRPVHLLPQTSPNAPAPSSRTAVSVTVHGRQPSRVLFVGAQASRDGRAHLVVTVGPITVVVYDRAALTDYLTAWRQATADGNRVFDDPEPDVFDELAAHTRRRQLRHFERTGQLLKR